jgi:hypothetical protein
MVSNIKRTAPLRISSSEPPSPTIIILAFCLGYRNVLNIHADVYFLNVKWN